MERLNISHKSATYFISEGRNALLLPHQQHSLCRRGHSLALIPDSTCEYQSVCRVSHEGLNTTFPWTLLHFNRSHSWSIPSPSTHVQDINPSTTERGWHNNNTSHLQTLYCDTLTSDLLSDYFTPFPSSFDHLMFITQQLRRRRRSLLEPICYILYDN